MKEKKETPNPVEEVAEEPVIETEEAPVEETISDEVAEKAAKADEYMDKYLRLSAEFDNFRKRTVKEKDSLFSDGRASCAAEFLPLVDNMERAISAASEEDGAAGVLKGMEMILKQLTDILKALSIEEIPALGEQFNPELHNAVMHIEDEAVDTNTVVEQFQKGYTMSGKVLRHSMVKVAN